MKSGKALIVLISTCLLVSVNAHSDTIALNYAWKPGLKMKSDFSHENISYTNEKMLKEKIVGSSLITTKKHSTGLQVDFADNRIDIVQSDAGMDEKMKKFFSKLTELTPSYIINNEGVLADVLELDKIRTVMQDFIDDIFAEGPPEVKQQMQGFLQNMLSKEHMMAQMHKDWNRDVGQWLGAEFESGYVYSVEYQAPVPLFGNLPVLTKGEYEYTGRVPCNKQDQENSCVELHFVSFVDPESAQALAKQSYKMMNQPLPAGFDLRIDYSLVVITEEKTLLPHYVQEITAISTSESLDGKKTEVTTYHYSYQ